MWELDSLNSWLFTVMLINIVTVFKTSPVSTLRYNYEHPGLLDKHYVSHSDSLNSRVLYQTSRFVGLEWDNGKFP